jgi:hypothetical protein
VDPEAVSLARRDAEPVAVPHARLALLEVEPVLSPRLVEQAHLDRFGNAREQREARAGAVVTGTERRARSRLEPAACGRCGHRVVGT